MNRTLRALVAKDIRLHGRALALVVAGTLLLLAAATRLGPTRTSAATAGFVFNINFFGALLLSEWLVARERSTRSFAWLRSLPADDRTLAFSKFILAAAFGAGLWTLSSALFARGLWRPPSDALVLLLGLLTFGAVCVATRWRINWRFAHVVPIAIMALPVLLFAAFAREDTAGRAVLVTVWNAPYGPPLAAAGLVLLYALTVWSTVRWLERADTYELVD